MNPKLIQYIQSSTGFQENTIKLVLESFKNYVHLQLAQKYVLPLKQFGVFSTKYVKPREGRNPRTGEALSIPGRYRPYFRFTGDFTISDKPLEGDSGVLAETSSKEWVVKLGQETKVIPQDQLLNYSVGSKTPVWTEASGWVLAGEIEELEHLFP
ncbi:HU family DNA-binding protein [Dolichospermum circinale]|uniref:HU family DNA-binding protein n=1 Tax=Dolichospermum circinale TaxID=109265 RepID=UPI00232B3F6B|nr:HU family DNA-binding protein [Dolichospermum circinale]MDB9453727.1 HU family DNA-binding protein [Dolichospermum circinale CS-541/06]MDB9464586.1 HU family DNA-binding protein [Dolichospermum circinale CS-541/04]MDB9549584.1 HU family DNA-binding protein [Dolichospermum circinale CS-1031]